MNKQFSFLLILLFSLFSSCSNNGEIFHNNISDNSNENLITKAISYDILKYYFILNNDNLDSSGTFLIFKNFPAFDSIFKHRRMMDSATFHDLYYSIGEDDFKSNYVVGILMLEKWKQYEIIIKEIILNDGVLIIKYNTSYTNNYSDGFALALFEKCSFNKAQFY